MTKRSASRLAWLLLIFVVAGALLQWFVLWMTQIPLGVQEEWTWPRIETDPGLLFNLFMPVFTGLGLVLYVSRVARNFSSQSSGMRCGYLIGLFIFGLAWTFSLLSTVPGIAGLERMPFVLYYGRSSGYFSQARENAHDMKQFLATYQERVSDPEDPDNHLHLGTHPPGLTGSLMAMIKLYESSPALTDFVLSTQPERFALSMAVLQENELLAGRQVTRVDSAVLWTATLITIFCAAGTVTPFYLFLKRYCSEVTAWWGAAWWLLVPATVVFLPKSDAMFPFFSVLLLWLWGTAVEEKNVWKAAAAGAVVFVAMMLSLAFLPIGLMMFLQLCLELIRSNEGKLQFSVSHVIGRLREQAANLASAGAAFLFPILLFSVLGGISLIPVAIQNIHNHASFYTHHTRTFVPWLLMNPLELSFSVGLPIALLGGAGLVLLLMQFRQLFVTAPEALPRSKALTNSEFDLMSHPTKRRAAQELLMCVLVWGILWVSGKNMGESARLWIFLMPLVVALAAVSLEKLRQQPNGAFLIGMMFLIQASVCVLTVIRIDGFHFAELL